MSSTTKIESLPFLNVSHRPSPNRRPHIGKRIYLVAIRQILPTILLTGHIFSFAIMTHLKIFIGIKLFNTKQCPAGLFSRIIPILPPVLPKMSHILYSCFVVHTRCWLPYPLPQNLLGKPKDRGESYPVVRK